jgi:hypothetical protein
VEVGGTDDDVEDVGPVVVGDGGEPICWAPGMRLKSGCGKGIEG